MKFCPMLSSKIFIVLDLTLRYLIHFELFFAYMLSKGPNYFFACGYPGVFFVCFCFCFVLFCFSGLHPWHMEVSRLGVELELQLPAYTTATAMQDPSHICKLHHSSWHHWILNPLSKARDQTCILMETSQIATTGIPGYPEPLLKIIWPYLYRVYFWVVYSIPLVYSLSLS